MKSVRNLYLVLTSVVAASLLLGGLAEGLDSGIGVGWCFAGHTASRLFVLVCHVTAAVGVVLLAWCWLKLDRGITSIAKRLEDDTSGQVESGGKAQSLPYTPGRSSWIGRLSYALGRRLQIYHQREAALEQQLSDLHIQLQLSQKQKKNTEAIIYSIRDAVVVVDECDRLLMANDAAASLFNFDFPGSLHAPIREVINQSKAEFVDFLTRCRKNRGRATRQEIEFADADRVKTFDSIVSCVYDDRDQVCGVVAVLHDVTREKEIAQMKNDFVSHVSHELKTPLASIAAYSEMLSDGEAEDEDTRKEFCSVIQSQADRLNRLIEDILNTARIESGLVKIEKEPLSLTILIEDLLQMIKSYAEEKGVNISGQQPIVHDQVYVDKDMISQVIVNLLSNAVKYTPAGGSVSVRTDVDELAKIARVSVTDTGVGIPEDEIGHVFDKFYRVGANKGQAQGTGLGLNLVKQIVERVHAGRVFVSSKPGEGSTFGFELPLATAQAVAVEQ